MKRIYWSAYLISLLLVVACQQQQMLIPKENSHDPIILFCPDDDCEANIVALLEQSQNSIHCAFYDLELNKIISTLTKKSSEVDVKIIFEKNNYDEQIVGNRIRLDNNPYYMHNKFCIIDNHIVWTGSMNPTQRGAYQNNNNIIVLYSKKIAENYKDEFQEMWQGTYKGGDLVKNKEIKINNIKINNYFCPEDSCEERVLEKIHNANESIYFMTFSFTSENIADALLFQENITIKGVFEKTQAGSKYSQFKRLKDFGLDVKLDNNKATMHHKVFIIDQEIVITGSYNPSNSGNTRNDENILIIHDKDIAKKFLNEFVKVWTQ